MPEPTRLVPRRAVLACLPAAIALAACRGDAAPDAATATDARGGTVVVSTPAEPDNLAPPITTSQFGKQVEDLVFERLADLGPTLNTVGDAGFEPRLARSWTWSADSLSIAFTLDPAARWHDGRPVRASDVRFTWRFYTDPATASPTASLLANIDSVTVRDSLTAVVWFARRAPEQFFEATYQMHVLPEHLLAGADRARLGASPFARRPIGSGPFRFVEWVPGQRLALVADTTGGRRRATLDRVVYAFAPDPMTAYQRFASGEADVYEAVRPDKVGEVTANPALRLAVGPTLTYHFLGFNLHRDASDAPHPIFGDRTVRRALSMAVDRAAVVRAMFDTLAVVALGPFPRAAATADTSLVPLPFAPDSAARLLDAAGWVRGADGMRARNGVPLAFAITVPVSSASRVRAAIVLQEQLRRAGVAVTVEQLDFPTFLARLDARRYDAVLAGWSADPGTAAVRQSWGARGARAGGENTGRYVSTVFDAHVDSGVAAFDAAAMHAHFAAAWRRIVDDAPAIWLAEPRTTIGLHARLRPVGIRPDAWWAGLHRWSIAPGQRLARDGAAVTAAR